MNRLFDNPLRTALTCILAAIILLLAACASIGRPDGGPRDVTPPQYIGSTPRPGATAVDRQRIEIAFDENIKLDDPSSKIVVSPAQKQMPQVSALGHRVRIELRDSLLPNTTYTIDFADAIQDLNEGNALDGFALEFSTGPTVDSLRVSGMVLEARTLEPAQGILVGAYTNFSDTAIRTLPFERIARTDQYGRFTIRGLRDTLYNLFAVNDVNRDYHWDRSENIAFYGEPVRPTVKPIMVTDTLRSSTNTDSLVTRPGVQFLPNDILLTWFNEDFKSHYITDKTRPERRRLILNFSAPIDTLPELTIIGGDLDQRRLTDFATLTHSAGRDSLQYWLEVPVLINTDTLRVQTRYQRTDSLDRLAWTVDTIAFTYREPKNKKKISDVAADSVSPTFKLRAVTQRSHDLNRPVVIEAPQPVDEIFNDLVRLEMRVDTTWTRVATDGLRPDSLSPLLRFTIMPARWQEGGKYRLAVDSAAMADIYGQVNAPFLHEFDVKTADDYSALTFTFSTVNDHAVVELLNSSDAVVVQAPVLNGRASFRYITPGSYYARLYLDPNDNHRWDTGNVADSLQPEEVYYYPRKLNLKKNWDIEQPWDIYATPLDMQKPYDIKKNKPKLKAGERPPQPTDEEEDETGMGTNFYDAQFRGTPGNQYDRNNTRRR